MISIPFNIHVYNFIILKYFSVQISSQSKGFVSVWKRSTYQYGLVCADNFDDTAATVVCKELTNYNIGISHCCSAYGPKNQPFVINDINCTGQEKSLQQCNYIKADSCQSGMYASVICTNYIPSPESGTRIKVLCTLQFSILADFGILIKYFLIVK